MSQLRPTHSGSDKYAPSGATAYLMVLRAVEAQPGLIHGKLSDAAGAHCAIGSYFQDHPTYAFNTDMIDEIAAVNDSMPHRTSKQRKRYMVQWLRGRLAQLKMPGFAPARAR